MIISTLLLVATVIFSFVTILFIVSLILQRNDIADIGWGIGIFLVAITSYLSALEQTPLLSLLLILVGLWSIRLAGRIFLRNIKKKEDYRYQRWRQEWGRSFYVRSYLQVYLLQGFLMIVVGYSVIHTSFYPTEGQLGLLTWLGLLIWCLGYIFEVVGDWQLDRFIKQKPKPGDILTTGLWTYTRHPNYFGEVTMWWAIWLMIAPLPMSYIALISPLMITFLILKVSGIPLLEQRFAGNPKFEEYKRKTSAFFPRRPRV